MLISYAKSITSFRNPSSPNYSKIIKNIALITSLRRKSLKVCSKPITNDSTEKTDNNDSLNILLHGSPHKSNDQPSEDTVKHQLINNNYQYNTINIEEFHHDNKITNKQTSFQLTKGKNKK